MYLISKKGTVAKLFFTLSFTGLFMYTILAFYTIHTALTNGFKFVSLHDRMKYMYSNYSHVEDDETKYILLWTVNDSSVNPFGEGVEPFHEAKCSIKNCYITTNKLMLDGDYTRFQAVIFNNSLNRIISEFNDIKRSQHQKFVFHSMQSSQINPLCSLKVDHFYNWTWTYRLNSDISTPFIYVKDMDGNTVAPSSQIQWKSDVRVLKKSSVNLPSVKAKSVSWVVNDCDTLPKRIITYVKRLKVALKRNNLTLDIYGCGFNECPEDCSNVIDHYNFYLALERSISLDYVTNEVLKAYNHHAVPIVIGGADYRKFLPDGSYINAQNISIDALASILEYTISNPEIYNNYFAWKKYYIVEEFNTNRGLCTLCSYLHDGTKYGTYSSYDTFRTWWYRNSLKDKCIPKGAETFAEILSYLKIPSHIEIKKPHTTF